jgi:hypothetical protein
MKTIVKLGLTSLVITAMLFSCKQQQENQEEVATESATSDVISSSAAVEKKGSNRKFIRTADIKFKVKNVPQSTDAIENATVKFGGFVTYTNLQSVISEKKNIKISQDSTLETTKYNIENNITIRVPNTQLDTVLKTIAKQIDFLDHRVIKADDVSIQMLTNQLAQNRSSNHEKRVEKAIDSKGKKLTAIIDAEGNLETKKEQKDLKKLENLSLQDQVNFSTLTLQIYQRETIKQEMIANEKTHRQNMGSQILDGLKTGWFMLENIIAFIVQLWALILIGITGYLLYKKYLKK